MLVSGSWDREVRFWDVRANRLANSIGNKTSICGDGVDVSYDNNYVATGGGTLGEGVQVWDFRNLSQPVQKFIWSVAPSGDVVNPIVNAVKFVPRQNLVLAGCSDDNISAKCFDYKTGETIEEFHRVQGNCFSLDVSSDGTLTCFGDALGALHFENINYSF